MTRPILLFLDLAKARKAMAEAPGQLGLFAPRPLAAPKHVEAVTVHAHQAHTEHGTVEVPAHTRLVMRVEKPTVTNHEVASPTPPVYPAGVEGGRMSRDERIAAKIKEWYGQNAPEAAIERDMVEQAVDQEMAAEAAVASGAPRKETLHWSGHKTGRHVGDVIQLNNLDWFKVTKVGAAKHRTMTSNDEDEGHGYEGEARTYQDVELRPATQEEIATEQAKLTPDYARRLKNSQLREHIASGGYSGEVAAAEISRREANLAVRAAEDDAKRNLLTGVDPEHMRRHAKRGDLAAAGYTDDQIHAAEAAGWISTSQAMNQDT